MGVFDCQLAVNTQQKKTTTKMATMGKSVSSIYIWSEIFRSPSEAKYGGQWGPSELNVDNGNDNCEAKSEAKSPRPLRGLQVDFSLLRGQIRI